MLDVFIEDLSVHTNVLAPLCLLFRVLQIEGEVSGDNVLVHLGRVVGWVHMGIRLDISKEGVTQRGNRDRYTTLLLSIFDLDYSPHIHSRGSVGYDDWILGS